MNDSFEKSENPQAESSASAAISESESEPTASPENMEPLEAGNSAAEPPKGAGRQVKSRRPAPRRRGPKPAHAAGPAPHVVRHYEKLVDEGDDDSFFGRHRTKIVISIVALLGGGFFYFLGSHKGTSTSKAPERMVSISLPPLPPPPPPPPPPKREPPPPKEEKMVQETAAVEKPKEEAPKAPEPLKEALGTGIKGNGPGMSGLGGSGDGGGTFGGRTGGGGSKYGYFAGQVQRKVATALRSNSRTKKATLKIQVRIWSDATGRITRAKLDATTGDPSLDDAIQNQVLTGLQLDEPPPAGMPMPIVMRLTARRP